MLDNIIEVIFGVKNAGLKSGLEEAKTMVKDFRQEANGQLAGALTFGGAAALIGSIVEYADKIKDLSDVYGVSTDILQQWGAAADQNASSADAVASAFNKLIINQSKAVGGNEEMQTSFAQLGVTMADLKNLSPEEIMMKIGASSMDAASLVQVLGKSALELRPLLSGLADGSIEMAHAMSGEAVDALAQLSDEVKGMRQTMKTYGGDFLAYFLAAVKSTIIVVEGLATAMLAVNRVAVAAGEDLLRGDVKSMKRTTEAIAAMKAELQAYKDLYKETIRPPSGQQEPPVPREMPDGDSANGNKELEKATSLMQKIITIRQQAAFELASDEEKMRQLIDREKEAREAANNTLGGTAEQMQHILDAEQALADAAKLRAQMEEKAKQAREKEIAQRAAMAERQERETEAARARMRDEEDRLAVLQETNREGETAAQRLEKELGYQNKLKDLEDRITKARKDGNRELEATLRNTQAIIQQQAQQQGIADKVADKLAGPDARRDRQREEGRSRRAAGSIESAAREAQRNAEANVIDRPDVFRGRDPRDRAPIGPGLNPGERIPGNAPKEQNQVPAKLDGIKGELVAIKEKIQPPLAVEGT